MTQRKRLAVARFWYEGNAFCLQPAGREDFERREWQRGGPGRRARQGHRAGGCRGFPGQPLGLGGPRFALRLGPAGRPRAAAVFQAYVDEVLDDLRGQHWDAIYLSLHGACITDADDSPELSLLRAIRAEHPRSDRRQLRPARQYPAGLAAAAVVQRQLPDLSAHRHARDGRALPGAADRHRRGRDPSVAAFRNGGAWLQSANMRTDAGPMADLLARARTVGPLRDIALHGGFPYANSPHSGASVWVWADTGEAAARALDEIYAAYEARFADFEPELIAPADGIRLALRTPGLVAVTDPADNPLSGGIGDTPRCWRPCWPPAWRNPASMPVWPIPVGRMRAAGEGAMLDLRLGGRRTPLYGEPVALRARVLRYTDGVFVNSGPMETGWPCIAGRPWCWPWARRSSSSPRTSRRATTRPFRSAWHRPGAHPPAVREGQEPFPRRLRRPVPAHRGYRCAGAGDADLRALRRMAGAAGAG